MMRWGIVGTGKIARLLATAIADSSDGRLVAVGSRSAERADAFAREFDVPRSHLSYDGVVADDDVDIVYVATHHPAHREWAVRAAENGKHVLCEKPLAINHADAALIVDAARRNRVFLLEAFAYRCHPQTSRLVELLRSGAVGEVRMIDAVFGYDAGPKPENYLLVRELGGGGMLDVGCYTTSMAHLVAATSMGVHVVESVDVTGAASIGTTGVDLSAAATVAFEGGPLARVACSIEANLESAVRIYGSDGRITVPSPWLPGRKAPEPVIILERRGAEREVISTAVDAGVYTIEANVVNELVGAGERSPRVMSWDESLANMRTLDLWRSAAGVAYEGEGRA
jgi:predicted dehydrogenase